MTIEKINISELSADPANARKHGDRNLAAIKASLKRFGQQKPIVVDSRGVVRAGNGTLAAAKALGWNQIAIVRSELPLSELTAFAIADNRTAELAEWDKDMLATELAGFKDEGFDLGELGFDEREVARFMDEDMPGEGLSLGDEKWMIVVKCSDEDEQRALLEKFLADGLDCRAMCA